MFMNKLHIERCPVCGASCFHHFLTCTDCYATGEVFEILECNQCGFRFTQDAPAEAEIGRYYETPDYISHSDTRQGLMNKVYHAVRCHMLRSKARLVERAAGKRTGRLLDIGTGTAYFPHTMYERGWDVEAVEKNAKARAFAWDHFGLNIKDDSQTGSFADRSFNIITLWHVMEHIEHLDELWGHLHRQLKDDGRLVVAVPNCSSADAARYKALWAAYDVPRHLWHFTPDTMQRMAIRHGFILCERHPMPFDGFYVSMLSEKYLGSPVYFLKGMLSGFAAWCQALVHPDRSSSMIYVFRKK